MYEALWQAFFLAGVLASAVAVYDYELEVTVYAAVLGLFIWGVLGWGASSLVVASQGQFLTAPPSPAVTLLCWLNALVTGIIPLVMAIWDWYDARRTTPPQSTQNHVN